MFILLSLYLIPTGKYVISATEPMNLNEFFYGVSPNTGKLYVTPITLYGNEIVAKFFNIPNINANTLMLIAASIDLKIVSGDLETIIPKNVTKEEYDNLVIEETEQAKMIPLELAYEFTEVEDKGQLNLTSAGTIMGSGSLMFAIEAISRLSNEDLSKEYKIKIVPVKCVSETITFLKTLYKTN